MLMFCRFTGSDLNDLANDIKNISRSKTMDCQFFKVVPVGLDRETMEWIPCAATDKEAVKVSYQTLMDEGMSIKYAEPSLVSLQSARKIN